MQLPGVPESLLAMAASPDSALRVRAQSFAATLNWPGKPVPPRPPLRALTAAEQQLFAAGERQYATQCAACHQANGMGLAGIAKPLVGSTWVEGNATALIRIVLHGKEGDLGLMPGVGAALSDDAVAAVLTYIRRSWGNEADPVTPGAVLEVRGSTMGRNRPWAEDELNARG